MATLQTLLDDLNDLLSDALNTKVSQAQKIRYINRGQRAMFPSVHVITRDTTVPLVTDTFEYLVPAALNEGRMLGVEVETTPTSDRYVQLDGRQFDFIPGGTGQKILVLKGQTLPGGGNGASLRLTAALPLTELAAVGDTYAGPAVTEELPVLYAMGMATARDIESRLHFQRFSTTQALNGTSLEDFQVSAQYWFDMFARMLEQHAMPLATP